MHHYRKTIRDELKARVTGLQGQVGPPIDSLAEVTDQSRVPLACVVFNDEPVTDRRGGTGDGCKFTRELNVSIVIVAGHVDDLDLLAAQVEVRMVADIDEGVRAEYDSTAFQQPKRGEFEFFALAITYKISFSTDEGSPDRLAS